jgi:hypothetical protein
MLYFWLFIDFKIWYGSWPACSNECVQYDYDTVPAYEYGTGIWMYKIFNIILRINN